MTIHVKRPRILLIALPLLALLLVCGPEHTRYNVLVIAVDTLRPDHLGCYGYGRPTSPNIDGIAEDGALFENTFSQAPWTLPSFASVFTSLYPSQHGATTVETMMRTGFPTLAEILAARGYATGAVVNAPVLRSDFGLNRGFGYYSEPSGVIERPADEVTRDALEWIDSLEEGPFLAFVHYFDPHLAYAPPSPYDTLFDPGYSGRLGKSFDLDYFSSKRAGAIRDEIDALDAADRNHIVSLYDGEIAFTDSAIGALLAGLIDRRIDQNTLVVLLSDHGEEFFEHGGLDHGHSLYGELIRVPLIMRFPDGLGRGKRLARQVRLIDVTPTILDYLGEEGIFEFEGVSLLPLIEGGEAPASRAGALLGIDFCLSEAMRRTNMVKSITSYPYKLIENVETKERSLFDLDADRLEQTNLAREEKEEADRLEHLIWETVFAMSSTWLVEMGAGDEVHVFSLKITPEKEAAQVGIRVFSFLTPDGRPADVEDSRCMLTGTGMAVPGLEIEGTLTLAFQADRPDFPVTFDLAIDGVRSAGHVYMGDSLSAPEGMPFAQKPGGRLVKSDRRPEITPDAPYFHIRHSKSRYGSRLRARLTAKTRSELRSLGYIQ